MIINTKLFKVQKYHGYISVRGLVDHQGLPDMNMMTADQAEMLADDLMNAAIDLKLEAKGIYDMVESIRLKEGFAS